MGIDRFFVQPIAILRPTQTLNAYNDLIDDWDNPSVTNAKGWLSRTQTLEVLDGRDAQVTNWRLFLPPDTDITATDRVAAAGHMYEVDGIPNPCWTPRGIHHLEVQLIETTG